MSLTECVFFFFDLTTTSTMIFDTTASSSPQFGRVWTPRMFFSQLFNLTSSRTTKEQGERGSYSVPEAQRYRGCQKRAEPKRSRQFRIRPPKKTVCSSTTYPTTFARTSLSRPTFPPPKNSYRTDFSQLTMDVTIFNFKRGEINFKRNCRRTRNNITPDQSIGRLVSHNTVYSTQWFNILFCSVFGQFCLNFRWSVDCGADIY